ncbi:MAG: glycerate kinase [candidate division KSB1 bacterium]|nr:glycerate kinase [candidate division KSB1 bacterium]
MKLICAPDSFKDSMPAERAARIMAEAVRSVRPDVSIVEMPLADGGEGTAATLQRVKNGEWVPVWTMGPLPDMRVESGFVWLDDEKTAVVEMAASSGLQLLKPEQRNPMHTTTFGTGELVRAAEDYGAESLLLAVGGSATVDMGIGMASALGWQFRDAEGKSLLPVGGSLSKIIEIIPPQTRLSANVRVMCDVENPLLGERGAARVYAPQKGASAQEVRDLETGLEHMAARVRGQA